MALPPPRRSLHPPLPPTLTGFIGPWPRRIVLFGGSAVVMISLFAYLADFASLRQPSDERPPPEPRYFELVPADLMTTRDGLTLTPGSRHDAADLALRQGDLALAADGYAELHRLDPRDRYAALLVACCAIERDDWAAAATALAQAAAPATPAASPLRSLRRLAHVVEARLGGDDTALADLWVRAVAAPDAGPPLIGRDPLREQFTHRLLTADLQLPTLAAIAERHGEQVARDFSLLRDDAPLDAARALLAVGGAVEDDLARELLALRRLLRAREPEDAARVEEALARRSALEPDNGLYELLRARHLSPEALASPPAGAPVEAVRPEPVDDEEAELPPPPITLASAEALAEAARRPRIDAHVALLLDFEVKLLRACGDRFGALHATPPREFLLLGDAALKDGIVGRALHADEWDLRPTQVALFEAAFALLGQEGVLACDPRRVQTPLDHAQLAHGLLASAMALDHDVTAWQERVDGFTPLTPLLPELRSRFEEALVPPPIPRLVDEVAARYAADLPALAALLKRCTRGG